MADFNKSQSTNKKANYIHPDNFLALKRFMDNAAMKHTEAFGKYYLDDPTTVGFSLWFDPTSPLFTTDADKESAINYLIYSGEEVRAKKLYRFVQQFKILAERYPHFFLTLSGLGNIYDFPAGRSTHEKTLTISTNESMDLRIASLIDNYVHATYDVEYRRRTVPINLTEFKMRVVISEIRSFRSFLGKNAEGVDAEGFQELNKNLGVYMIDFNRCVFDFAESNPFLETINNDQPEIAENSFRIVTGDMNFNNNKVDVFDMFAKPQTLTDKSAVDMQGKEYNSRISKLAEGVKSQVISTVTDSINTIKNEVSIKKDQLLADYNLGNVGGQLVNEYFTKVIDGKFKQATLGNVFFTGEIPSGANVVSDLLSGIKPDVTKILEGRVGDPQEMMSDAILDQNHIKTRDQISEADKEVNLNNVFDSDNISNSKQDNKQQALFRTLTEVFTNADKLESTEIETILEFFTKSNLGNIFTNGNNLD